MLDIPRLQRIRLSSNPPAQRLVAYLVGLSFATPPRAHIVFENFERVPPPPAIFAMNHTDRYNYFPFLYRMWHQEGRYMATWVKGKYYENAFIAAFMEKTNQLPTVSRGYLISRDFLSAVGRVPTSDEYTVLRHWVDAAASDDEAACPDPTALPSELLSRPRDALGHPFDPGSDDYAKYINTLFAIMTRRFVELNLAASQSGLDLLIFPQGTRSLRLLPSHTGISQIALFLKQPIVPVGCMGSERLYPGASPWPKGGRVLYRFGRPISYEELSAFHIKGDHAPFTPEAESRYREQFEGLAELVTERLNDLLDEPYRAEGTAMSQPVRHGVDRFI